ncbi:MAG: ribonuclease HI family protein [Candidatus Methanofastidiosa archaeon]|nr:ribonuclease HI family protein [Candidatus Methanofastidiosa archaeon]
MNGMELAIYADGAARGNPGPGSWAFLITLDGRVLYEGYGVLGRTTNNVAEYNAIINGMKKARAYGKGTLTVFSDSLLAINQLNGSWKVKKDHLRPLHEEVVSLTSGYERVKFVHVPRSTPLIQRVDALANKALDDEGS